jgi:hypothetical protein
LSTVWQAEEQRLVQKQTDEEGDTGRKTTAAEGTEGALATINGQNDVLVLSADVLQVTIDG